MKKAIVLILAFLLTGSLVLLAVSAPFGRVLSSGLRESGAEISGAVTEEEVRLARERAGEIAELYGFDPETIAPLITREQMEELNRQTSLWWHELLSEGKTGNAPVFEPEEMVERIADDLAGRMEEEEALSLAGEAAVQIRERVTRIALPLRQNVISRGLLEMNQRVDWKGFVDFGTGLPLAAFALCAVLSALIALLSPSLREGLYALGGALAGAALVVVALWIAARALGLQAMIREASESLALQYTSVVSGMSAGMLGLAGVMLVCGVLCLAIHCHRQSETCRATISERIS